VCDASRDSATCRDDQGPDESDDPTNETGRDAELEHCKPSSRWIGEKANNEPNEPSDYAR